MDKRTPCNDDVTTDDATSRFKKQSNKVRNTWSCAALIIPLWRRRRRMRVRLPLSLPPFSYSTSSRHRPISPSLSLSSSSLAIILSPCSFVSLSLWLPRLYPPPEWRVCAAPITSSHGCAWPANQLARSGGKLSIPENLYLPLLFFIFFFPSFR